MCRYVDKRGKKTDVTKGRGENDRLQDEKASPRDACTAEEGGRIRKKNGTYFEDNNRLRHKVVPREEKKNDNSLRRLSPLSYEIPARGPETEAVRKKGGWGGVLNFEGTGFYRERKSNRRGESKGEADTVDWGAAARVYS